MCSLQGKKFSAHFNIQVKIAGGLGAVGSHWGLGQSPSGGFRGQKTFTHQIPLDRI